MTDPKRQVQLLSKITVEEVMQCGNDTVIASAARVSTVGDFRSTAEETTYADGRLINALLRERHGTPFEHGLLTVRVHAPLFIQTQWLRHRVGFSYSVESGRYKEFEPVFWIPSFYRPIRKADDHKPMKPHYEEDNGLITDVGMNLLRVCQHALGKYQDMVEAGVPTEVARAVLPYNLYSSMIVTCNPRSIMAFLSLRTQREKWDEVTQTGAKFPSYPQYEIEEAANQLEAIFAKHWPITHSSFNANGRVSP